MICKSGSWFSSKITLYKSSNDRNRNRKNAGATDRAHVHAPRHWIALGSPSDFAAGSAVRRLRHVRFFRMSRCSSKRRRFASNIRSVRSALDASTPAAFRRTIRPFCSCTMRRASATSSSARRRSSSASVMANMDAAEFRTTVRRPALALQLSCGTAYARAAPSALKNFVRHPHMPPSRSEDAKASAPQDRKPQIRSGSRIAGCLPAAAGHSGRLRLPCAGFNAPDRRLERVGTA
jgi:hypothetical protein